VIGMSKSAAASMRARNAVTIRSLVIAMRPGGDWSAFVPTQTGYATATIPIVFSVPEDPVKLGLVASLARPGGNATGFNAFGSEVVAKRLALLHEMVPKAVRLAVLVNPANVTNTETILREVSGAARAMGMQIRILNASTIGEIEAAFATLARERPDALFVSPDLPLPNPKVVPAVKKPTSSYPIVCQYR
jgi:putative ABC transport system substrate-binding protein